MRQFLKRIVVFVGLFLLTVSIIAVFNFIKLKIEFSMLKEVDTLILGDSHSFRGIDPSFFHNGYNASIQAEPFVVTYWKYKEFLKYQKPEKLIVSVSPHNISSFNDLKFSNGSTAGEMFKRTSFFGDYKSLKGRVDLNERERMEVFSKEIFITPQLKQLSMKRWGGFKPLNKSFIDNSEMSIKRHYYKDSLLLKPSVLQMDYLDSIVEISLKSNVKVVMIGLPLHANYFNKIPKEFRESYQGLKDKYKNRVIFIDKSYKHEFSKLYFSDTDHLNKKGAYRVSQILADQLKTYGADR